MDCRFTTELGTVTVNEDVLLKVAGYSALECYGIVGMAAKRTTDGLVQLLGRENLGRGVRIRPATDSVNVDLFIIVEYGISISAVAATIIDTVKYKIEHLTGIKVGKVNVDEEDELAAQYGIQSIPTVLLFKGGEVVEQSLGFKPKAFFEDLIK